MAGVYEIITERIIKLLEEGTVPWKMPWRVGSPKNLVSGKPYRGLNSLILASAPYEQPWWVTFKQAHGKGGHVRKGEHGWPCVYWNLFAKVNEEGKRERIPIIRYYTLFNVEQTEGVEYPPMPEREFSPIEACVKVVEGMPNPPEIKQGGNQAFYRPPADLVGIPKPERFDSPESFYSTLFHELTHSTGHTRRLNREEVMKRNAFGSQDYSKEELVAEMGSAFLCGHCAIEPAVMESSASYIGSWLKKLRDDKKLVITAASRGQKACDYILDKSEDGSGEEATPGEKEVSH